MNSPKLLLPFLVASAQLADAYLRCLAWSMQLDYKGANPANQGSWGAYAAYRRLGLWATWLPTYEINGAVERNNRGWDFGVSYVPLKNISLSAKYFRGSGIDEYEKVNTLFGEIEMFF